MRWRGIFLEIWFLMEFWWIGVLVVLRRSCAILCLNFIGIIWNFPHHVWPWNEECSWIRNENFSWGRRWKWLGCSMILSRRLQLVELHPELLVQLVEVFLAGDDWGAVVGGTVVGRWIHVWFGDEGLTARLSLPSASSCSFEMNLAVDVALGLLQKFCLLQLLKMKALTALSDALVKTKALTAFSDDLRRRRRWRPSLMRLRAPCRWWEVVGRSENEVCCCLLDFWKRWRFERWPRCGWPFCWSICWVFCEEKTVGKTCRSESAIDAFSDPKRTEQIVWAFLKRTEQIVWAPSRVERPGWRFSLETPPLLALTNWKATVAFPVYLDSLKMVPRTALEADGLARTWPGILPRNQVQKSSSRKSCSWRHVS